MRLIIESNSIPDETAAPFPLSADAAASLEPWIDSTGVDRGYGFAGEDGYRIHLRGIGRYSFSQSSGVVRATPEPAASSHLVEECFHRWVVPVLLQWQEWEVLHASGLIINQACVALCGASEMGKSTLAGAWQQRGGAVYADDAVPFRLEGEVARLGSIPFQIRLRPSSSSYLASVTGGRVERAAGGDALGRRSACLKAVYLLNRRVDTAGEITLSIVAAEAAVPALLRQAYCLTLREPRRNRLMIENFVSLANAVPVFHLSYPTGLEHVEAILDHLTAHRAEQPAVAAS